MDDDGLNMRNWGYYEPSSKGHLGLQLMSTMADRDAKHYLHGRDHHNLFSTNGAFHPRNSIVPEAPVHMNYPRDSWINHREKFFMLPPNPNNAFLQETPGTHPLQILQPPTNNTSQEGMMGRVEEPAARKEGGQSRKRQGSGVPAAPKVSKAKKAKKPKESSAMVQHVKTPKKSMELVINGIDMDISGIPIPVCSCTGSPKQCYRWGCGGWQSACCTTNVSTYPLPMNTKRRGSRIAGRKMSQGAFKKVLEKMAAEGYNFANAIDLKNYWARHGTNKFVTISASTRKRRGERFGDNGYAAGLNGGSWTEDGSC